MLVITACDSTDTPDRELCSLTIGPAELEKAANGVTTYEVTYRAEVTGDAIIDMITFEDVNGVRTEITRPMLPWTRTVTLPVGSNAIMTVQGAYAEDATVSGSFVALSNPIDNAGSQFSFGADRASACGEL
ncbi:MAG: hypothetical protein RhofKO_21390 [Rhodothermales bacterium]